MAEGVAKVQERTLALLGLVTADDAGFHLDRPGHGAQAGRLVAGAQRGAFGFKPVEEGGVAEKAVLHHLAIARQKVAVGQGVEDVDVGQHQAGLVEGADEVLALRGVDPGLAADGTVDLRQKRGRQLHEADAPAQDSGGKAHKVADHATAKGQDHILAFHLLLQQPFGAAGKVLPVLRPLPRRQGQRRRGNPFGGQCLGQSGKMPRCDGFFGDDGDAFAAQERRDFGPGAGQKALADPHLIGAFAQINRNCVQVQTSSTSGRAFSASTTRAAISSTDRSAALSTTMSAIA